MKRRILLQTAAASLAALSVGRAGGAFAQEPRTIRVALSAFQDVSSIYVGIEQGFFTEENIVLDIQKADWPSANELLVGGHVDIANSSDADVILQNANDLGTTLAFPHYFFGGGGLMFSPEAHQWQTYDEVLAANGGDQKAAMNTTLAQAKGSNIGIHVGGGEYATFVSMIQESGLNLEDYTIVNLVQEELPPALLSGSIDIMISGIPQRLAVLRQGYKTLIDQTTLPYTVSHNGFAASRAWVDANWDLAVDFERALMKTMVFIEENPDVAFPIIAEKLREAGTVVEPEDLANVWNNMEFFPSGKDWYLAEVATEGGRFYWRDRFETITRILTEQGQIRPGVTIDFDQVYYGLRVASEM